MEVIVQAHKGTGVFSRIIAWFSRSKYSHVSMWFMNSEHDGAGVVLEAIEGVGVREVPASWYQAARTSGKIECFAYANPFTDDAARGLLAEMRSQVGTKYDWAGVLKFVTRRAHGHDTRWFCSEYVAHFSAEAGRPLFWNTESWDVKPSDIPRSLALTRWVS